MELLRTHSRVGDLFQTCHWTRKHFFFLQCVVVKDVIFYSLCPLLTPFSPTSLADLHSLPQESSKFPVHDLLVDRAQFSLVVLHTDRWLYCYSTGAWNATFPARQISSITYRKRAVSPLFTCMKRAISLVIHMHDLCHSTHMKCAI